MTDFGIKLLHSYRHSSYTPNRMNCACVSSSTSYERLPSLTSLLDIGSERDSEEKDKSNEKEIELEFHNDDGSLKTVIVERNLRASDLCQLLALKNHVPKDSNWTLVEHWVELGIERSIEDHEEVLAVHRDMEGFSKHTSKRFVFRKDFKKYDFFLDHQFFPSDMVDLIGYENEIPVEPLSTEAKMMALQNLLTSDDCPAVFSHLWVREQNKQVWRKAFFLLKNKILYYSYKVQVVAKFLRSWRNKENYSNREKLGDGDGQLQVFAHLDDYTVYTTLNAKNQFRAPTEFGICLRPNAVDIDDSRSLRCLSCESGRARMCWVAAMRLAKYGKQLRENYRAFRNKQLESLNSSPKSYNSYHVPNESVRSRVAMDFTGSVGRIVDDPKEAKAIAAAEGYLWRRRWRPVVRQPGGLVVPGLDGGIHTTQPWFHAGMSREQASRLLAKHGTADGVFLVRESRSTPGSFVLTFACGGKILHSQIMPVIDPVRDTACFSLDSGVTKFYDLLQLVEFYQLNAGCLPTRLTFYIVQSPSPGEAVTTDRQVASSF